MPLLYQFCLIVGVVKGDWRVVNFHSDLKKGRYKYDIYRQVWLKTVAEIFFKIIKKDKIN